MSQYGVAENNSKEKTAAEAAARKAIKFKVLITRVLVVMAVYFVYLLIGAASFLALKGDLTLGNLGDFTSEDFGNALYFVYIMSSTIGIAYIHVLFNIN